MDTLFSVKDKTVVITGGGGVLGGEMAKALAGRGAKVAILDYNLEAAQAVASEIVSAGGEAFGVECNVLDRAAVDAATVQCLDVFGQIDILINGAGGNKREATCVPPESTFFDLDPEAVRWVMDLNCLGTILPSQAIGQAMADAGEGVIINISSMNAFRPLTRIAAYSAAKAAVSNFTQWLSTYMAQNCSGKIRVNAIAPGFFLTNQNRFLLTEDDGSLTARGQQIIDHTPMGRFGESDELIGTLLWLVTDAAKFVTGIVVPVDGGFSAYSGV
ncbi:MAG: SDR family oxidoreductase [Phycisphaerales bacterium]|jgi:NAD(P)-dependent dehydrogenase (short-subunit alcohol dehydrogenase family)|nr:SDR family oxidoreductase [Phycisphaerales bacterium]MBT7171061.1 SDR family oxidoreductase [Phycisphaerales bacterium]